MLPKRHYKQVADVISQRLSHIRTHKEWDSGQKSIAIREVTRIAFDLCIIFGDQANFNRNIFLEQCGMIAKPKFPAIKGEDW